MALSRKTPMPGPSKPMERGKPLNPGAKGLTRTPFRSRAAPLPRSALPCTEKPAGVAKTRKAPVVTAEERLARKLLRARSGGLCEVDRQARAVDYSHRIGEGVGGAWSVANAIHMCREHHALLHREPAWARDQRGWRLRSTDTATELPALLAGGWFLLDVDGGMTQVDESDALLALAG